MKEPCLGGYTPPKPFGLYVDGVAPHEVLRLLLGSVNIYDKSLSKKIVLNTNFMRGDESRVSKPEKILAILFEEAIELTVYEKAILAMNAQNGDFFRKLQRELTLALVARKRGQYGEAFLYLYRILELISVAVPMLYALTRSDFRSTHDFMKSLIASEKDGELSALSKLMPSLAAHGELAEVSFDFSVSHLDAALGDAVKEQLRSAVCTNASGYQIDDSQDVMFSVSFVKVPKLFAAVRNRMFHYRNGESNIDLGAVGGANAICSVFFDEFTYWFALVYAEVIRVLTQRYS